MIDDGGERCYPDGLPAVPESSTLLKGAGGSASPNLFERDRRVAIGRDPRSLKVLRGEHRHSTRVLSVVEKVPQFELR